MSLAIYLSLFLVVTLNLMRNVRSLNWLTWFSVFGMSVIPMALIVLASDYRLNSWMQNVIRSSIGGVLFYCTVLFTVGICFLIDELVFVSNYFYRPGLVEFLRQVINNGQSLTDPSIAPVW
jgi:hypothetical protein